MVITEVLDSDSRIFKCREGSYEQTINDFFGQLIDLARYSNRMA